MMTFQKRIKALSFESLHELINQARHEIHRRQEFIERIPPLKLQEISFSVRARDLLYRTIADKKQLVYWQEAQKLTLSETLKLLEPCDWRQIQYKNAKVFGEICSIFQEYKAPVEWYYTEIEAKV
ncbi:hypothetical protein [Spirosoma endbachense]|uniref:Uncharacterized protein n=1 Tax=Spirosoma endbachense TaxID=2666025 RepID=A0A6P1VVJ9_9BACT|nr:hypothetical protein [Spirosoma endbachense]QHV97113.1 hypothetical protein GJR95_19800 [Spirosoma endbachense]